LATCLLLTAPPINLDLSYHVVSDNCRDEWEAELPAPGVTMQSIVTSIVSSIVSGNSLRSRINRDRNAIGEALLPGEGIVKDYVIVQILTFKAGCL